MSLDHFLHFFVDPHYNKLIIYGLFALIILFTIIWTVVKIKEDLPESSSSGNLKDIESTLKKVLEQTSQTSSAPPPSVLSDLEKTGNASTTNSNGPSLGEGQVAISSEDLEFLRTEIEDKNKEIEKLKNASGSSDGSAVNSEEHDKLLKEMNELKAKLQEYEIIEDDIADLSLYKDENAKLKEELEALKSGGGAAAPLENAVPAPSAEEAESVSEPEQVDPPPSEADDKAAEDALLAEIMAETGAQPEEAASDEEVATDDSAGGAEETVEETAEPEGLEGLITDDLVSEFAAAIESSEPPKPDVDKKVEEVAIEEPPIEESSDEVPQETPKAQSAQEEPPVEEPQVDSEIVSAVAENTAAKVDNEENFITDDVLAEFAAAVNGEEEIEDSPVEIEPETKDTATNEVELKAQGEGGDSPLDEQIDTSKMLSEAEDLSQIEVQSAENALEGEMDIEKMAEEAMTLKGSDSSSS